MWHMPARQYCILIKALNQSKVVNKLKLSDFAAVLLFYNPIECGLEFNTNMVSRNELLELYDNICIRYDILKH